MAYVVTTITGDRKLAEFSKIACADACLEPGDLKPDIFSQASLLHFGSISLISSPAAEATQESISLARKSRLLISYDPNVRIGLWPSALACRQKILDTLSWADIVKINLDELEFLTGSRQLESAEALRKEHKLALIIVTLDADGAYFACAEGSERVTGFKIKLVEATGAGDGFAAGLISGLLPMIEKASSRREQLERMGIAELRAIVSRANAVGALTCTRKGAIPALPTSREVKDFLKQPAVHPA